MAEDFISGRHAKARIYFNNSPWEVSIKSIRVEELATEVTDQVNGDERARFQKITDGYRVTAECFDNSSAQTLINFITNQSNEDAIQPQLPLAAGIPFKYLNGSRAGYTLSGCTLGPMDLNIGGRTERVMNRVTFRAQYFKQVPAV